MKSLNKLVLVSSVLSVALSQMSAYKVVDEGDKVIDIYGSARGYVGFGGNANVTGNTFNDPSGSALFGLQSNSRVGIKAKINNLDANVELALQEESRYGYFRHMWGSYTFGSAGTLLFGKANTPSVPKTLFSSDTANIDQGHVGFGGLRTASRKVQISYSIAGATIALVDDTEDVDAASKRNGKIPRIAAGYYLQNEDKTLDFQVGGTYKYYNKGYDQNPGSQHRFDDVQNKGSGSAFHIFAAIKSQTMDKKLYFSGMFNYGMNADLYREQRTSINLGSYKHEEIYRKDPRANVHRAGIYTESGYKISDTLSGVLGLGYQLSFSRTLNTGDEAHTFMAMAQLPVKLEKSLTITPQIGYYGAAGELENHGQQQHSILAFVRLRYDF